MALNEETVKNKIVIPYFRKLGFEDKEIDYEIGFEIQLGLSKQYISKTIEERKRGYLDLLIKRGDQPIFVIETKSPEHTLTDKDRDQVISYARLLDKIAPYSIVSNGIDTKIYDSITRECLDDTDLKKSSFVKNGYSISLNEELRYEALKNLFGYNYNNLLAFSKSQIGQRMNSLRGSEKDLTKKYVPELYTANHEVEKEFDNYLKSNKIVFALIGEQGVGKTNYLCNLAIELINEYPVLFFNCSFLTKGISQTIAEDFSWTFSADKSHIQIVKRLEEIIKNHNKRLFLILDAIDEWTVPYINKDLNEFLMRIKDGDIRLIVSCKDSEWPRFLEISGLRSEFVENTYTGSDTKGNKIIGLPGVKINRLNDDEHKEAIEKYKRIYNFSNQLSGAVLEESKLPLMLRVIYEICENANKEIDPDLNSTEILDKYLNKKLEKVSKSSGAKDILRKIGNELYLLNLTEIEESRISDNLGVDIGSEEYISLFSHYILEAKTSTIGKRIIRYYFEKIRDFIIVYYSKNWGILDKTQFKIVLDEILSKQFGESLLSLYLREAGQSHLEVFQEYNKENIERCIIEYESIIQNEFPQLKDILFPYGKDNLGMIYIIDSKTKSIVGYGYRQTNDKHPEKIAIIDISSYRAVYDPNELFNEIFHDYETSQINFNYPHITINPSSISRKYIKEQVSKIMKEGKLKEINNIGFALEKTYEIIYQKGREFGLGERTQDTIKQISNLSCNEIIEKMEHYKIHIYAERCYIEQLRKEGKLKEEKRGTITTYSYSPTPQDRSEIQKIALELIDKKSPCLDLNVTLSKEYYELRNSVDVIKSDREFIGNPLLPIGDLKKPLYQWESEVAYYSDVGIKEYVESFFRNVFNEYRILVETNFDKVKKQLPLYRSLPVHLFAEISTPQLYVWGNRYPDREIIYTFIKSDKEDYEIYINTTDQRFQRISPSRRMTILSKKGSIKPEWIILSLVSSLLREKLSAPKTPIRHYVYNLLNKDLKEIKIID
jgi:hypothetical protein